MGARRGVGMFTGPRLEVGMFTFLLLLLFLTTSAALGVGSQLTLIPCGSPASTLVYLSGDSLRDTTSSNCATFVGASPAQLVMQPCMAGSPNQTWLYDAARSAVSLGAQGPCLNTQGGEGTPRRPVSTWPCSDLSWNSFFSVDADGKLAANCTAPGACGAGAPRFCVGAALGRALAVSTVVRYWTVEATRSEHLLNNESAVHTVANCAAFRGAVAAGWPDARITWAFSWDALHAADGEYPAIRALVAGYVVALGDEFTFIPGGYFAPMYNAQAQTNRDIHDALAAVAAAVGGAYKPKAIIAGYLGAQTLAYLAAVEGIHVAQATIFSQFNIDYGDGDGGSPYPYYPSVEHYLKPAQGAAGAPDFIDTVVLDGWTVDFLAARRDGFAEGFNSRMGVGPIETIRNEGPARGFIEQMHATAQHFDQGFALNGEAFVTSIWEISLATEINVTYMTQWLAAVRAEWPDAVATTHGEYGLQWRAQHAFNDYNYSWVEIGSGIGGSDADKEVTWFVNRAFRLVLLRNLTDPGGVGECIDFTRYENVTYAEPAGLTRSWNLMYERGPNMKQSRGAVDAPRALGALAPSDQLLIKQWLPGLPF